MAERLQTAFCHFLSFNYRRYKILNCSTKLGMVNDKMDRRGFIFGYHNPLSFVNMDLQISENITGRLIESITGMRSSIGASLRKMLLIFLPGIRNTCLIENIREGQQHREALKFFSIRERDLIRDGSVFQERFIHPALRRSILQDPCPVLFRNRMPHQ